MKFRKALYIFCSVVLILSVSPRSTAGDYSLRFQNRTGFQLAEGNNLLSCDYLNIYATGNFTENFSFVFRNKMNKILRSGIVEATEFLWLQYDLNDWVFRLGKMPIEHGGYEYDEVPMNVYFGCEYWNNYTGCFNYAATVGRRIGRQTLSFQLARSPMGGLDKFWSGRFAYSLSLAGSYGWYENRWSVNFYEAVERGRFFSYQVLGNRFKFNPVCIDVDLFHRMDCSNPAFFKDFSVACKAGWEVSPIVNIFLKTAYDLNCSGSETIVRMGTDIFKVGGGLEIFPVKGSRLFRIHGLYYHDGASHFMAGVTFDVDILKKYTNFVR